MFHLREVNHRVHHKWGHREPTKIGSRRGYQNQPHSFCLNIWKKGLEKPERREGSKQVTGPHVRQGDPSRGGSSSHEGKKSQQCADSLEMNRLNLCPDKATSSLVYPLRMELLLPCEQQLRLTMASAAVFKVFVTCVTE